MFACYIRLVDDYAIHYPIALCEPLNAKLNWHYKISLIARIIKKNRLAGLN